MSNIESILERYKYILPEEYPSHWGPDEYRYERPLVTLMTAAVTKRVSRYSCRLGAMLVCVPEIRYLAAWL